MVDMKPDMKTSSMRNPVRQSKTPQTFYLATWHRKDSYNLPWLSLWFPSGSQVHNSQDIVQDGREEFHIQHADTRQMTQPFGFKSRELACIFCAVEMLISQHRPTCYPKIDAIPGAFPLQIKLPLYAKLPAVFLCLVDQLWLKKLWSLKKNRRLSLQPM